MSSVVVGWGAGEVERQRMAAEVAARVADDEAARADRRGLLSARQRAAVAAADLAAEVAAESARAKRRGLLSASEAATLHALRRIHAASNNLGDGGAVSMAPLGSERADIGRRRIDQLRAAAGRGLGDGWHDSQARAAGDALRVALADQVRARVAGLLRFGLLGRASARGARMAAGMSRRWLRANSRREALAVSEVGAAAGVDDTQAGRDWCRELQSIAGGVYARAAAYGAAIVSAPLAPCRVLVARGLGGVEPRGGAHDLRRAVFGRGRRPDGGPLIEWTGGRACACDSTGYPVLRLVAGEWAPVWSYSGERRVRADSLAVVGRGALWVWAARQAGREMHSARYGLGGRDGREVAAGWRVNGSVAGDPLAHWGDSTADLSNLGATPGPVEDLYPETGNGEIVDIGDIPAPLGAVERNFRPSRRASVVRAARDSLALAVWEARRAVAAARRAAMAASSTADRIAAGSALGLARRNLSAAVRRADVIGGALRGAAIPADVLALYVEPGGVGERLTAAGRAMAKRLRDSLARQSLGGVRSARSVGGAGVVPGDEIAAAVTIAPYAAV